jgi:hypothetical protein
MGSKGDSCPNYLVEHDTPENMKKPPETMRTIKNLIGMK